MIAPALIQPEGYRMIESLDIKNFRCFENLSLQDLTRINVIVGRNASGKTALLEAIYLALGAPALTLKVRGWRGLGGTYRITEQAETMNAIWKDYFFRFDQRLIASIAFKGSQDMTRSLLIRCEPESGVKFSQKKGGSDGDSIVPIGPISFEWWKTSRRIGVAKPELEGESIKVKGGPEPLPGAFFSSTQPINQQEAANWFSDLSKRREERPVIEALQRLFPFINSISVEIQGNQPMIHADIASLPEKIPVGLISSGVNRLVGLLVAIGTQRRGVMIVDEIENGFHFKAMPEIWQVLYDFCKRTQVQLFASTHSSECLDALESVMIDHENDFSLIRTEREDGKCVARHFGGLNFRRALEQEIEVR
jgi:AAA15 family ATPase/GTPase